MAPVQKAERRPDQRQRQEGCLSFRWQGHEELPYFKKMQPSDASQFRENRVQTGGWAPGKNVMWPHPVTREQIGRYKKLPSPDVQRK
jgi:hypothetical protein